MADRKQDNIKFSGEDLEIIEEHQILKSKMVGVNLKRQQSIMAVVKADLEKMRKDEEDVETA